MAASPKNGSTNLCGSGPPTIPSWRRAIDKQVNVCARVCRSSRLAFAASLAEAEQGPPGQRCGATPRLSRFCSDMTVCPSGLRGWTQVPLAQAAWVQIPQLSVCLALRGLRWRDPANARAGGQRAPSSEDGPKMARPGVGAGIGEGVREDTGVLWPSPAQVVPYRQFGRWAHFTREPAEGRRRPLPQKVDAELGVSGGHPPSQARNTAT